MRKIAEPLYADIGSVVLFEPDLREILSHLTTVPDVVITFVVENTEFDTLEELRAHRGEALRLLEIKALTSLHAACIVTFGPEGTSLSATGLFELPFHKLKTLLIQRRRFLGQLGRSGWAWVCTLLMVGLLILAASVRAQNRWIGNILYLLPAAAFLFGMFGLKTVLQNRLILTKQHEHRSFMQRHEENLWRLGIGIGSALAGAVATYLLTH